MPTSKAWHVIMILLAQFHGLIGEAPESVYEAYGDYWDQSINNNIVSQNRDAKLVGAFSMDHFDIVKLGRPVVSRILPMVIRRYDLLIVSGIFDEDQIAVNALLAMTNLNSLNPYAANISKPGTTSVAREQFGLIYKKFQYEVQELTVYDDKNNYFRRPPVVASMKHKLSSTAPLFGIVNVHLRPMHAKEELDALHEVVEWVKSKFSVEDVLIAGDFRSGCGNILNEDWESIKLWTMPEYVWVTSKDLITTMGKAGEAQCSHEKMVITGKWLLKYTYVNSGRVFKFNRAYNLDHDEASAVLKNYPIEVVMRTGATDGNE